MPKPILTIVRGLPGSGKSTYVRKLADAIERDVMARTPYTVFCSLGYEDIGFIVHVFNATSEQAGSDVRRLLRALSVDDQCDVWTYSPEETKRYYPAYYKEVKP